MPQVTGFTFDIDNHSICENWCGCTTCSTCWLSPEKHMQSKCPTLLGYLTSLQPQPGVSHRTGIRACESSCWCVKCGACWSLDEYHGSMNCTVYRQVKDVFACDKAHVARHEEAGQPDERELRMLTIGPSSIFQQNTSIISEEVPETNLDRHDTLQLKSKPTDLNTHGKENPFQLTKYAKMEDTSMERIQKFNKAVEDTKPLRSIALRSPIPEYSAPTITPDAVYNSDSSGDITQDYYTAADQQDNQVTPKTSQEHHKGRRIKLEFGTPSSAEFRHGLEHKGAYRKCSTPKPYGRAGKSVSPPHLPRPQTGRCNFRTMSPPSSGTPSPPLHSVQPTPAPPKLPATLISPSLHANQQPALTNPPSPPQHTDCSHTRSTQLMTEYVEESFKYERDVGMDVWQPSTTTQLVPSSLQSYLISLEDNKLSETNIQIQHAIVLRKMREALEEAIVKDTVPNLDREVASFMRSLRLLGVGVCREIIERFPGQQCSASSGP